MTDIRTLLLIDKNPAHAEAFREALLKANDGPFHGEWDQTLSQSMELPRDKPIWAIFASLPLPAKLRGRCSCGPSVVDRPDTHLLRRPS
jgi:hypothetical protein